jgi:hypothetical protein
MGRFKERDVLESEKGQEGTVGGIPSETVSCQEGGGFAV